MATGQAIREKLFKLEPKQKQAFVQSLTDEQILVFSYDWEIWGRHNQQEPYGDWNIWLILAGRGWGKTRTGAEWIKKRVEAGAQRIALVAPTAADIRDTMVEGVSGILSVFPLHQRPLYEPSKRRITFYTGAVATLYSGDEPERLRGANTDTAWVDELCAMRYPDEVMDMLDLGLRIGEKPQCIITTTPKTIKILKEIIGREGTNITKGSTYENRDNLSPAFFKAVVSRLENTRLGRQELHGEILEDAQGALWNRDMLEKNRVRQTPELIRIVVGVDPAVSKNKKSNETGIVIAALGADGHAYVLDDRSLKGTPKEWAERAVTAYHEYEADRIVPEINQGGDMVEHTIRTIDEKVAIKPVRASKGKQARAEPIAALYEQGKVHHVGYFSHLEDQLCNWEPNSGDESPDRLDSMVWALTELMLGPKPKPKPDLGGIDLHKGSTWSDV